MKDDEFRILGPGETVESPKMVDIEQGNLEHHRENYSPERDPSKERTMRVMGHHFGGLLHELLEEDLARLTNILKSRGQISNTEEVVDVVWQENMPHSIVIQGGNYHPTIPFSEASNKNITKTANYNHADPKLVPKGKDLAVYVESLKLYLHNSKHLNQKIKTLIEKLPVPEKISFEFSNNESIVLFETVNYLWKEIIGQDIIDNSRTINSFDKLSGCYLMLNNGLLLHGLNHYSIIKNASPLVINLLDLNGLTFHEYLSSTPERLIAYVIRNGGVRMFINEKQEGFFQMTEEAYIKWARSKIRNFDLQRKIVKIMDLRVPYKGWKSGITVQL